MFDDDSQISEADSKDNAQTSEVEPQAEAQTRETGVAAKMYDMATPEKDAVDEMADVMRLEADAQSRTQQALAKARRLLEAGARQAGAPTKMQQGAAQQREAGARRTGAEAKRLEAEAQDREVNSEVRRLEQV